MPPDEEEMFKALMAKDAQARGKKGEATAKRLKAADEYETIKLY